MQEAQIRPSTEIPRAPDPPQTRIMCRPMTQEFTEAMRRYGLEQASSFGKGGVSEDELRALFDKYDKDGSGSLSYEQFALFLFKEGQGGGGATTSLQLSDSKAGARCFQTGAAC